MRKILSSIMLVAVAAMAFVSCQKEETQALAESKSTTLTLNASVVDTKTYIENNAVLWGTGEYVQLYYNDGADKFAKSSADAADSWNGESSAMFSFDITYDEADSYVLGGIYPASCVVESNNTNPSSYKVNLPAIQNASASSYDPKAFIMVMQPETVITFDTEAHLASFRRAVALNKVTLTGVKENVSSVEIKLPEGKYLAGRRNFDLTTGVEGEVYNSQTNTIKVNAEYTGSSIDVWFTSWGVELAEGDQVTIKMTSASKIYTRTISVNSNGLKFVEGKLNTLSINMASAEEEVLDNLAGEYLIAAMPGAWVLMSGTLNTNNYYESVTSEVTSPVADVLSSDFYDVENIEDYVWVISEVDDGYAVQNKSTGKYVAWTSGNSANTSEEAVAFSIAVNDDKSGTIIDKTETDRSLQYNSSSPRFAFYTSTQKPLYFIPWVPDKTPRIIVAEKDLNQTVAADATELTFNYTTKNISGVPTVEVAENPTMTILSATADDGKVTVTFNANEEESTQTATIKLSYEGAAPIYVVINQKAKAAEGSEGVSKEYTVTYEVASTSSVTVIGTAPEGSTATFKNTYSNNKEQMTKGNSQTYTFLGYKGCVIKSVTLSMKSNSSSGAGTLSLKAGTTTLAAIATATNFNAWYDNTSFGNSYRDVLVQLTNSTYVIGDENVVLVLSGTTNSIYCESVTITYLSDGGLGGGNESGETPEPTPDPEEPENPDTPEIGEPTTITMTTFSATEASMDANVSYTTAKGGGTVNPAINGGQIRLYQNSKGEGGGTITITAADGYKLSSVTIGSSMKTSVAYTIGSATNKSTNADLAAYGKYTVNNINAASITFYCMGTDSSSRLYVNYLSATYEAE